MIFVCLHDDNDDGKSTFTTQINNPKCDLIGMLSSRLSRFFGS